MPIRKSSISGGSSSTGFNLDVGSSGNNTFVFLTPQPAGGYTINSQLEDSTVEFYAIAEDGTLAGYTNTKTLTASTDFDTLVVYGATTNDLITFEFKETTSPTSFGQEVIVPAFVSSISESDLGNVDDTTIVSGGSFAEDVQVTFTGTDNVVRNAKSIVRNSSTELIVTRPDSFVEDNSPYIMEVLNPNSSSSLYATKTASVTAGGDPLWDTSSGSLGSILNGSLATLSVSASDPDGSTVSYSLVSGSIPNGLSLNSVNGELSGTPSSQGTYSFILAATDTSGNITNRSFSIEVVGGGLSSSDPTTAAALAAASAPSGTYWINVNGTPTQLYCDTETNGGGWTSFASAPSSGNWFGGNSGSQAAWLGLNYSYGTYSTSGAIGDYWRSYSSQSPTEVMFKTGNGLYWISFPLSYIVSATTSYTSGVTTSNNMGAANSYNTSVTIMNRSNAEDPWINAGTSHAVGDNYMFWGEASQSAHTAFKNANGGIIAFVR